MISRVASATLALALVIGMATGCQPRPEPSPSGPVFATEEEAFAAAEETYRAYVDALNARRADPTVQPDPTSFLTGDALEAEIETENLKDQSGLAIVGDTVIAGVQRADFSTASGKATLLVCLDSSGTRVVDSSGTDVTPADRETRSLLTIGLDVVGEGFSIVSSDLASDVPC